MNSVLKQAIIDAICEGMGDEARPWDASNVSPGWLREYVQYEVDVITDGEWFEQLVEKAVAKRIAEKENEANAHDKRKPETSPHRGAMRGQ